MACGSPSGEILSHRRLPCQDCCAHRKCKLNKQQRASHIRHLLDRYFRMLIAPCTAQSTDQKHKNHPEMPNKTHNATKVHLKMFFECSYYRLESPPIYILYSSTLYCTVDDIRHNLIPPKPCGWLAFHLFDGVSMLTIVVS